MVLQAINEALQKGSVQGVTEGIRQALEQGLEPRQILNEGLLAAMEVIGIKFKK